MGCLFEWALYNASGFTAAKNRGFTGAKVDHGETVPLAAQTEFLLKMCLQNVEAYYFLLLP